MIEFFASFGSFGQGTAAWVRGLCVDAYPPAVQGLHAPAGFTTPKARSSNRGESAGRFLGVELAGDAGGAV